MSDWRKLLNEEDQKEFEKLLAGEDISPEFEQFFNRSKALQELMEEEMRNDELGQLLREALKWQRDRN